MEREGGRRNLVSYAKFLEDIGAKKLAAKRNKR